MFNFTPWTSPCRFSVFHYLLGLLRNSAPLSPWCYLTISSSAAFAKLLPSVFLRIRSFNGSALLHVLVARNGLPFRPQSAVNIQGWFPLQYWLFEFLAMPKGLRKCFSKLQFESINSLMWPSSFQTSHLYRHWKSHGFDYMTFVGKW